MLPPPVVAEGSLVAALDSSFLSPHELQAENTAILTQRTNPKKFF
jgi:hypothetical protein